MAEKNNYIQALQNPIFKIIAKASKELNIESYVVGGFVRDFILQRDFKKDIDIVTVGSGIDLAIKVSELLPKNPKASLILIHGFGEHSNRYFPIALNFV